MVSGTHWIIGTAIIFTGCIYRPPKSYLAHSEALHVHYLSRKILGLRGPCPHSKAMQPVRAGAKIQSQIWLISEGGDLHLRHHALMKWDSTTATKITGQKGLNSSQARETPADHPLGMQSSVAKSSSFPEGSRNTDSYVQKSKC